MADEEARLLVEALQHVPEDDRQRVLAWLVSRIPAASEPLPMDVVFPDPADFRRRSKQVTIRERDYQVVPMRFPSDELARLRAWSEEHGFSMAAVVRGLVSRFLDGQPDADPTTPPGGSAESA